MTNRTRFYAVLLCGVMALSGCTEHATEQDKAEAAQAAAQKQELADEAIAARKGVHAAESQLAQLPPPAKGRYLQVHSIEGWNNPFLIVGRRTIKLRVVDPDPGDTLPNNVLPGEKLHVVTGDKREAGNKRELTVRLIDLPEALAALPESSWQYGRVVAVDEDPAVPRRERPQMRRNVEAVIALLNDLDVVVNEWSSR